MICTLKEVINMHRHQHQGDTQGMPRHLLSNCMGIPRHLLGSCMGIPRHLLAWLPLLNLRLLRRHRHRHRLRRYPWCLLFQIFLHQMLGCFHPRQISRKRDRFRSKVEDSLEVSKTQDPG
mmetsp:Transcript_28198/g.68586  ORF Transcript_28198/g.68586 Transcript_28198/m.68586 type:complete len:120 (-) Transcript_28198:594-953(-)